MKTKINVNDLLMDVLIQSCLEEESIIIDNKCISAYEDACDYLEKKGYLIKINSRVYKLK